MKLVEFYGDELEVVEMENGKPGVVARRLVENLGLSWSRQREKLEDPIFSCTLMCTTGSDGKEYEMLVIPVKSMPAFLFSINPNKVREDLKDKLARYRLECVDVLYQYWARGYAINPRPTLESSLEDYTSGTGAAHANFLNNILDVQAKGQEQREVTVEIMKEILRTALDCEEVDIERNFFARRGVWQCMDATQIVLVQAIETESALYFAKHGLPESVPDAVELGAEVGKAVTLRLQRAARASKDYSFQFEESLFKLVKAS